MPGLKARQRHFAGPFGFAHVGFFNGRLIAMRLFDEKGDEDDDRNRDTEKQQQQ